MRDTAGAMTKFYKEKKGQNSAGITKTIKEE